MDGRFWRRLRRWLGFIPMSDRVLFDEPPLRGAGRLPTGLRIYAIGDIHGEKTLFDDLARTIAADVRKRRPEQVRAVFLGDYIDRGPDSRGIIERLATTDFPIPFEALRGNHEDMLLRAVELPEALPHWCQMGGLATLQSYGVDIHDSARRWRPDRLHKALLDALPPRHLAFLRATSLSFTAGDYFFVHAGARPGVPLDRQDEQDLMWIREECYASSFDFGKVLVHGHTPHKRPEDLPRRINVDTGAFKWGRLTAVVLEENTRRFLSARS